MPERSVNMPRTTRITELARTLLAEAGVPEYGPDGRETPERFRWNRKATRVFVQYLRSGEFTYVTDLSDLVDTVGSDLDPVEQFWLPFAHASQERRALVRCQGRGLLVELADDGLVRLGHFSFS